MHMKTTQNDCGIRHGSRRLAAAGMVLLASMALVASSRANVYSWSGGGGANANWNNPANWGFPGTPANGDTVVFPASQPDLINTNNLTSLILNQIRFAGAGGGYDIRGFAFTVTNSIVATNSTGANTVENSITLATATSVLVVVSNGVSLTLGGVLSSSGTVGVTTTGAGTLTYAGGGNNSYSGTTLISAGTLQLNVGGTSAFGGSLVIGDGTGTGSPTLQLLQSTEIADLAPITINQNGLLDLNNFSETVSSSLTLNTGTAQTGAGTLTLSSGATVTAGSGSSTISGNLNDGGGICTFALTGDLLVSAVVSGNATIDKSGSGTLTFSGTNTYTGQTVVQQGIMVVQNPLALGTTGNGTVVSNTATLELAGGITISNESLTLNGPGISAVWGSLDVESGINTWAGPVTNNVNSRLDAWNPGSELHINGPISGAGGLELFNSGAGGGNHFFEGAAGNTYAGTTTVDANTTLSLNKPGVDYATVPGALVISGTVRLLASYQTFFAAPVTINDGGLLDVSGYIDYIGALNGTANSAIALGTALANGYLYADYAFGGTSTFNGLISGVGTLDMQGSGTLILNNNDTYTGQTRVSAGTLLVNGSQPQVPTYVSSGATLGGAGTVGAVTLSGGAIATGASQLQINGDISSLASATTQATISGSIRFANGLRTILVDQSSVAGAYDIVIFAAVGDTGSGFKVVNARVGYAGLHLYGTNTFTGPVTVDGMTLYAHTPLAMGTTASGTFATNGATFSVDAVAGITNETLTLAGGTTFSGGFVSATAWAGPVVLQGDVNIYGETGTGLFDIQGPISGTGNVTLNSQGEPIRFSGALPNTYAGTTTVANNGFGSGGILLQLAKGVTVKSVPGPLMVGSNCVVRLLNSFQIYSASTSVTLSEGSLLDLNGFSEWVGPLNLKGSTITASGQLFMSGDITVNSSLVAQSVISGSGILFSNLITITNNGHNYSPDLLISANLGSGGTTNGLIKNGGGEVALGGNNTITGSTTVNNGDMWAKTATALGNTNAPAVVNSGGELFLDGGVFDFCPKPLVLNGSGSGQGALYILGNCTWDGPVTFASDCVIYPDTGASLNLTGLINGPGGFTKNGLGTLTFSGNGENGYTGATVVNTGVLQLNNFNGHSIESSSSITIGDGVGGVHADVIRYTSSWGNLIYTGIPIIINNSGLLDLNGEQDDIGPITLNGGDVATGTGLVDLTGGDIYVPLTASRTPTISGGIQMHGNTIHVDDGAIFPNLTLSASINDVDGSGFSVVSGNAPGAFVRMTGSNSFTGPLTISGLTTTAETPWALGTTAGGTLVTSNGVLFLYSTAITNETVTLAGGSTFTAQLNCSWNGPVVLTGDATVNGFSTPGLFDIAGPISGTGNLVSVAVATNRFSGTTSNTFAGTTTVGSGRLILNKTTGVAVPGNLVINSGATVTLANSQETVNSADVLVNTGGLFDFGAFNTYMDTLHGSGTVNFGTGGWIYLGLNNGTSEFDGLFTGTGYSPGWTVGKTGTGTFTIGSNSTYTAGITHALAGKLIINGSQPLIPVTVDSGATLGGKGAVGIVTANGTILPGNSPGILSSSNVTFSATGIYRVEIAGSTPGSGYDQLNVTGTVALASAKLQLDMSVVGVTNTQFIIITNDGVDAVTGTFSGLAEGSTVTADNGAQFKISYHGGSGNDVMLTQITVPAASTISGITKLGGGGIQINGTGVTNLAYTVSANTNLLTPTWISIGTATANALGQIQFMDPGATNFPIRFYRFTWP